MAIQVEPVAHNDLVSGVQTTLHSHAGGGGGVDVKSGVATNILSNVTGTVSFATNFAAAPSVVVSWGSTAFKEVKKYFISNVTVSSFDITYQEKTAARLDVHWIATDAGNV